MLIVVSPAKKLDETPLDIEPTQPVFVNEAMQLAQVAGDLNVDGLRKLMHISEPLAKLNKDRFDQFGNQSRKAAMYLFSGDTYQGLDAASLDDDAVRWAQDRLRILSGLYGVLRPLDEIEPYRLEMGSKLKVGDKKSLYAYWGDRISKLLNQQAAEMDTNVLVNCASQEYFGAVDLDALKLRVITPAFYEDGPKGPKIVSFYAKRARGAMARFVLENRVTDPAALDDFDTGGYQYQPDQSTPDRPVFLRPTA